MELSTSLMLLIGAIACLHGVWAAATPRIIGGYTNTVTALPYIVNVRRDGNFICGGSLVHPKHVVTAAHCVYGYGASRFEVVGGATYLTTAGARRKVETIFLSRSYNKDTMNMDVSVLRLVSDMTGSNIAPISLCSVVVPAGATVKVSGWGLTKENGSASNQVRSIDIPTIARSRCQSSYNQFATLTDTMMCASEAGEKDSCNGDSGGPLVYKNQLCGIVSWGIGCAQKNYPGVYTDVYKVRSFIDSALAA